MLLDDSKVAQYLKDFSIKSNQDRVKQLLGEELKKDRKVCLGHDDFFQELTKCDVSESTKLVFLYLQMNDKRGMDIQEISTSLGISEGAVLRALETLKKHNFTLKKIQEKPKEFTIKVIIN